MERVNTERKHFKQDSVSDAYNDYDILGPCLLSHRTMQQDLRVLISVRPIKVVEIFVAYACA